MLPIILRTDSYKFSHYKQYPEKVTNVNSYIESRGYDKKIFQNEPEVVFYGLQGFIRQYLTNPITQRDIDVAENICFAHGVPFNKKGWEHILNVHNGNLPLEIKAVPEGTVMKPGNVMVQVQTSDSECAWLVSYIETALLRGVWYPTTVATLSREIKKVIYKYLTETSDSPDEEIMFKLHDFGARGVSSAESAGVGGSAHLVNFMGTDTIEGALYAMENYDCEMPGFSIPASEHSTMTILGKDGELEQMNRMIDQYGSSPIYACVSDSYDIYNAVKNFWGKELKDRVLATGNTLVVRPDSGDPVKTPVEVIKMLGEAFDYEINTKGYKVLHPSVRVIQGDGINFNSLKQILELLKNEGWSASNIAFGMGGGLLQNVNRDTLKLAMKASAACYDGKWNDVWKDPVGGGKTSKKGRLALTRDKETVRVEDASSNILKTVYYNGKIGKDTFENIRNRAKLA